MTPFFEDRLNWTKAKLVMQEWMGTPYRHLWMKKQRGADCSLFVGAILKELGIIRNVVHDIYPPDWYVHSNKLDLIRDGFAEHIKAEMANGFALVKIESIKCIMRGDMLTFSTVKTGVTNHAGIMLDPPTTFVHSVRGRGVSLMNWGKYWEEKTTAIYRVCCGN
jgi:cell wall-associated NlpC family hydrolase